MSALCSTALSVVSDGAGQQKAFFHHDHKGNGYVGNVWACAFTSVPARS
ncbi:predicted hydrolases or acyltransferases [Zymobacter palmae]|uniref:Predicted hydrolases or acyltransferases n=1 Tax=Zymobacter palmae TaxID=33074 RepID=A0A348HCK8_9GAMM|nr:predicted hydrolases or acyltransferases [Zymobacter palmae]